MNRSTYFNYIEERLNTLVTRIKSRGKLNIVDLNIHAETFFAALLSLVYGYNLVNANMTTSNATAIDLVDNKSKVIIQVTSVCTKQKIQSTLNKIDTNLYKDYRVLFVIIAQNVSSQKKNDFIIPHDIHFDANQDIYDISDILKMIYNKKITDMKAIREFVYEELGVQVKQQKLHSILVKAILLLAEKDLTKTSLEPEVNVFQIQNKIKFNNLDNIHSVIDENIIYYAIVDGIYREFDLQGKNKSIAILNNINYRYVKKLNDSIDQVQIFWELVDDLTEEVENNLETEQISYEEAKLCATIIIVDAFARCKVFENPEGV